jgi:hypothetical protein
MDDRELKPIRFVQEPIEPQFDQPPLLEKKPGCPDGFLWRNEQFRIIRMISEWHDYQRRGRMSRNMRPEHASRASSRGSWGVGQDYYRVETDRGQIFDIYYDRAPAGVDHRKGGWFLEKELGRE